MIEAVATGLTELDFNFFEMLFVAGVQTEILQKLVQQEPAH